MLACTRIGATHTVVFGGFSAEALRDRINDCGAKLCITADGGWRRGKVGAAEGQRRRGAGADADGRSACVVARRTSDAVDDAGRARRLVGRRDGEGAGRLPARQPVRRAPAVHPLHLGHDREAEGDRAHDRRLPAGRAPDDEVRLRSARRRHLLVHRRHRLGDRAQLRRLRPALERRDQRDVRGRARPSRRRIASGRSSSGARSRSSTRRRPRSAPSCAGATSSRRSTICRRCACSAASASRSIPRRGCGTTR